MMDYWRRKYLLPAIQAKKKVALIGIGDARSYVSLQEKYDLEMIWDPYKLSKTCNNYCVYDINEEYVKIAKELGIKCKTIDLTTESLDEKFDYIFSVDVIEHVENPIRFLKNIKESLLDDGVMVITTPNSIYWRNFVTDSYKEFEEHNFTFNKKHFINLSKKIGLEICELSSFQTTGGVETVFKKALQYLHYLMVWFGRGNSIIMVARKANS